MVFLFNRIDPIQLVHISLDTLQFVRVCDAASRIIVVYFLWQELQPSPEFELAAEFSHRSVIAIDEADVAWQNGSNRFFEVIEMSTS